MRALICVFSFLFLSISAAQADNGLVVKKSAKNVTGTIGCLESVLKEKGMTIFARIDHAAGAAKVGQDLRPTQLLIFGNPKLGSQLMTSAQSAGIDLPMKALAWQDARGQVWLAYNAPVYLAGRHGIGDRGAVVEKMTGALGKFTDKAIAPAGC